MGTSLRRSMAVERPSIPRPDGAPRTFVCPACDEVLWDEVDYMWCPVCDLAVDWVDLARPLWCCATCDALVNEPRDEWPRCARCDTLMDRVHSLERPPASNAQAHHALSGIGAGLFALVSLAQVIVVALDPLGFAFVSPLLLLVLVAAIALLASVMGSLGELAAIARDRATRVVHGLEHACIHLLLAAGLPALAGQSERAGFVVELANDGRASADAVHRAVVEAIRRVHGGERALAYSRRCGTSRLVALVLVALVVTCGAGFGLALGVRPGAIAAGASIAALAAWAAATPLGMLAQRYLTVSTEFAAARAGRIVQQVTADGTRARYLVYVDVELRALSPASGRAGTSTRRARPRRGRRRPSRRR